MAVIKQLPPHEAQKIAAGEVVDRPANIVKELLENSIDAGSTRISVSILDGGKQRILIEDNGCGMVAEDARRSILRHATSKISRIDDLEYIATYGFRGEALASITGVSRATLITKHQDEAQAIKLIITGSTLEKEEPCAYPGGTSLQIDDLFFNVPARKKFLRATATELRAITQLVHAVALAHPQIHIKFLSENNLIYNCGPVKKPLERMLQLSSNVKERDLLELKETTDRGVTLTGFVSHHHITRYDRNQIFLFVNKRPVKHYKLANALIKGYQNVLPPQKYPLAAIFITIDPQEVDVNIHPRKEEVAFLHPRRIEALITQAVKNTLEGNIKEQYIPASSPFLPTPIPTFTQLHKPLSREQPSLSQAQLDGPEHFDSLFDRPEITRVELPAQEPIIAPLEPLLQSVQAMQVALTKTERAYRLIGQLSRTYILIEQTDGLMMIDQHAAHERVLYEQFGARFKTQEPVGLLFPYMIELAAEDIALLEEHYTLLEQYGLHLQTFGEKKIMISATPAGLQHVAYDEFMQNILSWIHENGQVDKQELERILSFKIRAMMACKAAIKAGDELSSEKMYEIIDRLMGSPNMLTCPHGRPTSWYLHQHEIEKKFKRKL